MSKLNEISEPRDWESDLVMMLSRMTDEELRIMKDRAPYTLAWRNVLEAELAERREHMNMTDPHPSLASMNRPENMTEPAHKVFVEGADKPFEPADGEAIFFLDDHGYPWVRFKIRLPAPRYGDHWVCVPRERILWILQ